MLELKEMHKDDRPQCSRWEAGDAILTNGQNVSAGFHSVRLLEHFFRSDVDISYGC